MLDIHCVFACLYHLTEMIDTDRNDPQRGKDGRSEDENHIDIHCSKYLREEVYFFISHSRGLIQLFSLKFGIKQWSDLMLYTTASKHLPKLWNWPYVHSVENHHCSLNCFEQCTSLFAEDGVDCNNCTNHKTHYTNCFEVFYREC